MTEAVVAQKRPYGIEVKGGRRYFWCACGRSARQPFCDGSHAGTGFDPVRYDAPQDAVVWFCGCKATNDRPVCDGSHKRL